VHDIYITILPLGENKTVAPAVIPMQQKNWHNLRRQQKYELKK
jgi:hypothetical protein